jgi:hypothetical protein
MSYQEMLSDDTLGASMIVLALGVDSSSPIESTPCVVTCDYSRALPNGVVLPVLVQVFRPDGTKLVERVLSRVLPDSVDFLPDVGGKHLVRIAETNHNRWFGALVVDVIGDPQREDER